MAFSGAALRCQTAVSACSKWCPSAQKHFRVRKNTGWVYHGTFKLPLYRSDSELWRGLRGHVHSSTNNRAWMLCCLWKLLDSSGSLTLFWLEIVVFTCHGNLGTVGHTHSSLALWTPTERLPDGQNLFDRLICNQWSSPVSLRSSILSLSSFLFLSLSASCSNTTTIAPAPLYLWSVKSLFFPAS